MDRIRSPIRNLRISLPSPRGYSKMPNLYADTPTNGMETVPVSERFPDADNRAYNRRNMIGMGSLLFVIGISVCCGIILEFLSSAHSHHDGQTPAEKLFLSVVKSSAIQATLEQYAEDERIAGSPGDLELAKAMKTQLIKYGFPEDSVSIKNYEVLLNTPKMIGLQLLTSPPLVFNLSEPSIPSHLSGIRKYPAFHFYSADGNVTASVIYANYGRNEDLEILKQHSILITQHILLIRSGKISAAAKVRNAEVAGASGVLIYDDPADGGQESYPTGGGRPENSFQSASVYMGQGDPSTPYDMSTAYRERVSLMELMGPNITGVPAIPSLPISASIATQIIKRIGGKNISDINSTWQGGLSVQYTIGGNGTQVNLVNENDYMIQNISNLVAVLEGKIEPDRYVVLGSQRDSSVSGISNPGSGTAVMMEVARGIGQLLHGGWRPKRTIIFGSWSAEEYGMVGSAEWVQEYATHLRSRAIIYLDLSTAVVGPGIFECSGSPSLKSVVYRATRLVYEESLNETSSSHNSVSIFDSWMKHTKETSPDARYPKVQDPGSYSEIPAFLTHLGIPSLNIRYRGEYNNIPGSIFDSLEWMNKFGDPGLKYHRFIAQIWGVVVLSFSENQILPYNFEHYAYGLYNDARALEMLAASKNIKISFTRFKNAAAAFEIAALHIIEKIAQMAKGDVNVLDGSYSSNPSVLREINDRLMWAERVFLAAEGRPWHRHIVFAPAQNGDYVITRLPGLRAAIETGNLQRSILELSTVCRVVEEAAEFLSVTLV